MNIFKISLGIFLALSISRFVPHPPNFTSLISLSFYIPLLFGLKFLPFLILTFIFTDFVIGFHQLSLFTWGSIILIGYISKFFNKSILNRISGSLFGAFVFFLVTNFGVWMSGQYSYSINGIIMCFTLAIPFFTYNLISTIIFSSIIEGFLKLKFLKKKFSNI